MKQWIQLLILMSIIVLVTACSNDDASGSDDNEKSGSDEGETYTIGATQITEHPSLDEAYDGFQEAFTDAGLDVDYDFKSAQNDQNNVKPISDGFVSDNVDLIFANSTPSAIGALQATDDIPIVFTSVTDAVDAELVPSMDEPGENITGVVDLHPDAIDETVSFMDDNFPDATVGMVYNAGEQNSVKQIESVKEVAEDTGLQIAERTVANSSEVQQAATSLAEEADLFYIITDNTVVSALDSVAGIAEDQEIPLFVGEPDSLEQGGFATFGIDYHTIGYRSGEIAADILTGEEDIRDIPVEYPPEIELFINKDAAEKQGVEWNEEWDDTAQIVEDD